jgi:hypothetical protein
MDEIHSIFFFFFVSFQLGTYYVLFHVKWTSFSLMPIQNRPKLLTVVRGKK